MPYRIKARNSAGSTVTRWDMRNPRPITDRKIAEELALDFAQRQIHQGPWTGFVEYYHSEDSINSTGNPRSTDHLTARPKPGMVNVK